MVALSSLNAKCLPDHKSFPLDLPPEVSSFPASLSPAGQGLNPFSIRRKPFETKS